MFFEGLSSTFRGSTDSRMSPRIILVDGIGELDMEFSVGAARVVLSLRAYNGRVCPSTWRNFQENLDRRRTRAGLLLRIRPDKR